MFHVKLYRCILPYLVVLLMASASFADESEESSNNTTHSSKPRFELIPWNMFIGGCPNIIGDGAGFVAGVDWVFMESNFLYVSFEKGNMMPTETLVWTLRTQALWAGGMGFYLQPTIQYMINTGVMFKVSMGPEIGYKLKKGLEYGGSIRLGSLIDLLNIELGFLGRSERIYINFIFNVPTGLGIWV
ncbi:MAG: hypothetical protein IIT53_11650 [Fibrobacter sp.]|nr:hypothetical protein [Fibrobacter sp.]